MFEIEFGKDAIERILYTMAETAIGIIGTAAILSQVDGYLVVSGSLLSGIVTFLKCVLVEVKNHLIE